MNCTAKDIARKAVALKDGENLFFSANLGGEDLTPHAVTAAHIDGLEADLLLFSAVGGGNAFAYDRTEYLEDTIEQQVADLIADHCRVPYEITGMKRVEA